MACKYKGCNEPVNSPHDEELCVFHAPKKWKGITVEQFNKLIREKIEEITKHNEQAQDKKDKEKFNFKGFVFPGDISFTHDGNKKGKPITFNHNADFSEARFSGNADFSEAQFSGDAFFFFAQFSGYDYFIDVRFSRSAYFNGAQFSGYTFFGGTQFSGYTDFREAKFSGDVDFDIIRFNDSAVFINITIKKTISYTNITLTDKVRFYFINPQFLPEAGKIAKVIFDAIQFNPFAVYFENIRPDTGGRDAYLIFRYCQLKDVYFTDNDMSLFSFYKSSFDEARFSSSDWGIEKDRILFFPFKRHNVIPEERFLDEISQNKDDEKKIKELRNEYKIKDLNDHEIIASLYRRMKTALDNTKDYQQASWFYFNEFEMKRCALEEKIESSKPKWNIFQWKPFVKIRQTRKKIFSKYLLYFCYRTFAGYGEKPMWSFLWFWAFTAIFAFGHMVFGLKSFPGGVVTTEYKFFCFLSDFSVGNFLREFASAFGYSLSQAIPKNYIPYKISNLNPINPFGITWSILNTITLLILLVFIAIGLKRHFRRF